MGKSTQRMIVAIALAACMGMAALAGCASGGNDAESGSTPSGVDAGIAADSSAADAGIPNLTWLLSQDAHTLEGVLGECDVVIMGGVAGDTYSYTNNADYTQVARGGNESAAEWLDGADEAFLGIWAIRIGPADAGAEPGSSVDDLVAGEYELGSVTLEWVTDLPDPSKEAVLAKLNGVADFSGATVDEQQLPGDASHVRFIVNDAPDGNPSAEVVAASGKALVRVYAYAA